MERLQNEIAEGSETLTKTKAPTNKKEEMELKKQEMVNELLKSDILNSPEAL